MYNNKMTRVVNDFVMTFTRLFKCILKSLGPYTCLSNLWIIWKAKELSFLICSHTNFIHEEPKLTLEFRRTYTRIIRKSTNTSAQATGVRMALSDIHFTETALKAGQADT